MENTGDGSSGKLHEFQGYDPEEEQRQQQYNNNNMNNHIGGGGGGQCFVFPEEAAAAIGVVGSVASSSSILPWPLPPVHPLNSTQFVPSNLVRDQNQGQFFPSLPPLPPPPPPSHPFYGDLYARRASTALQFAYGGSSSDPSGLGGLYMGSEALIRGGGVSSLSAFGGLELGKLTQQEIMDAKALAASKSHSEAERRRRERINAHLAKLRSLLPSTTKVSVPSIN